MLAADEHLAALLAAADRAVRTLNRSLVDQRADERALFEWVADLARTPCTQTWRQTSSAIDSWTIRRRVVVQRWPAVPTAPKTMAAIASSWSASCRRGSRRCCRRVPAGSGPVLGDDLANAPAHAAEPVAEIEGRRLSATIRSPTTSSVPMTRLKIAGVAHLVATRSAISLQAMRDQVRGWASRW